MPLAGNSHEMNNIFSKMIYHPFIYFWCDDSHTTFERLDVKFAVGNVAECGKKAPLYYAYYEITGKPSSLVLYIKPFGTECFFVESPRGIAEFRWRPIVQLARSYSFPPPSLPPPLLTLELVSITRAKLYSTRTTESDSSNDDLSMALFHTHF